MLGLVFLDHIQLLLYNFVSKSNLPNGTTVTQYLDLLGLDYGFMYDDQRYEAKDLELFDELLLANDLHIIDFAKNMAWKCSDLIYKCRFKDAIVPCENLFQLASTFNGYCCSFNLNQTL